MGGEDRGVDTETLTCANCDSSFEKDGDQVTKFHVTIADTPYHQKSVSILEALATVCRAKSSKLGGYNKMVMCTRCATVVADLYRSFVELMQLSKSTAYVAKVLLQADLWHRARQSAGSASQEVPEGSIGSQEENEFSEDYITSVLAVELNEVGGIDGDHDLSEEEALIEGQETDEAGENKSSSTSELRGIVPKKRKMTDGSDDLSPNSRNRRKSAMPIKISASEATSSPGGSEEGQAIEANLRRSDRRRISSLSQNHKETELDEEFLDQSEPEPSHEPPPPKKRKKIGGRLTKGKSALKGTLKRKRRKGLGPSADSSDETKICKTRRVGSPNQKIPCTECEETFNYYWMLDYHVQSSHENKTPRSCDDCGFEYFAFRQFEVHNCIPKESQAEEALERPYRCSYCGKTFKNHGHYTTHCGSHDVDEDKRYKCPHAECKLTFKFPKNLEKHEKTHLEDKSWQCSVCGKVFRVKRNLTIHMEIHKEEKKYLCPICGERFAQRRGLFRHLNTHGSNLKHKCPVCQKGFKRKDHVTQHLNSKVHPKIQFDGSAEDLEGGLQLLTFDPDHQVLLDPEEDPDSNSHPENLEQSNQPDNVNIHEPHNFISNPSVVLSQHPNEFAFSDLLHL